MVEGKVVNFRGTLTICSADNPAACSLGGYKALHSAIRKCRSCMAVDADIQTKVLLCVVKISRYNPILIQFTEAQLQLRTRDTHTNHVADLTGPLHGHIATTYGVSEKSILNESVYFHVVTGLVPDVMHDVLEGTTQLTLKCLLHYLIREKKFFSLSTLNTRISSFNYGPVDNHNKPSEISSATFNSTDSYTLKQSGEIYITA